MMKSEQETAGAGTAAAAVRQPNTDSRSGLAELSEISLDPALPPRQRGLEYLAQLRDPYCFRCAGRTVRVRFAAAGTSLEETLAAYCRRR